MVSVENNSILKKISAVIVMITALVFFTFSVDATGTPIYTVRKSSYQTFSNVTYSVDVLQFKASSEGTSMLPGGMSQILYVEAYIQNTNDQAALCSLLQFQVNLDLNWTCSNLYTYGGDFMIGMNSLGFYLYPNTEFSYDDTMVVVPPNSTMYFVGAIELTANLDQTGQTIYQSSLESVNLVNKPYSVSLGSYSYGTSVDLSPVISAINELIDTVSTSDEMLQLIANLTYTGTNYQYSGSGARTQFTWTTTYNGVNKIDTTLTRLIGNPYLISVDVNANSYNDTSYVNGAIRYPIAMKISHHVLSGGVSFSRSSNFKNFLPTTNVGNFYINYFVSDIYDEVFGNMTSSANMVLSSSKSVGGKVYLDSGYYNTYLIGYIDIPVGSTITWSDVDYSSFYASVGDRGNVYFPLSEYSILRDLYLAYSQVNGIDDSSDLSNDVADVSDSNHIIEESYYSANASAIEATGLSNYRFSNEQNNGIGQVADDFMLLWNALGSWNGVYVFSLTMALATFIMRHGGLFTIKRETSDKGGDGD